MLAKPRRMTGRWSPACYRAYSAAAAAPVAALWWLAAEATAVAAAATGAAAAAVEEATAAEATATAEEVEAMAAMVMDAKEDQSTCISRPQLLQVSWGLGGGVRGSNQSE
jgi:hypothetical protein